MYQEFLHLLACHSPFSTALIACTGTLNVSASSFTDAPSQCHRATISRRSSSDRPAIVRVGGRVQGVILRTIRCRKRGSANSPHWQAPYHRHGILHIQGLALRIRRPCHFSVIALLLAGLRLRWLKCAPRPPQSAPQTKERQRLRSGHKPSFGCLTACQCRFSPRPQRSCRVR